MAHQRCGSLEMRLFIVRSGGLLLIKWLFEERLLIGGVEAHWNGDMVAHL